ncbi:MAG: enoyl-CoA hydratase/isomerase family protein, partial [Proteobacteria bacterium]|nr:enoyl-CoA hydratase/isomerase family protein [Pseudomonadota bacterium]MBU2469542.1 enoyl-CoA hydratase/isomerase family protein [Pseudomonadota bacterium]
EIIDHVGVFTLCNPPANALSQELKDEFLMRLAEISSNEAVRALIITGAGDKFFAAGADVPSLLELDHDSGLQRILKIRDFYEGVAAFEKPVIGSINGICMGGGLELALCCDIRVAADHARLGLPEVGLGIIPGAGGTQRLPRIVGPGWANCLLMTGQHINAQDALRIGLVQAVSPLKNLHETAFTIAKKIADNGPVAVRAVKKASATNMQHTLQEGLEFESRLFAEVCGTADKNEGVNAFLQKRKPQFQGR